MLGGGGGGGGGGGRGDLRTVLSVTSSAVVLLNVLILTQELNQGYIYMYIYILSAPTV